MIWGCVVCENNSKEFWGCVVCENNNKVIWGCVVCENNSKVIWGCVVCDNNSKVIWGCVVCENNSKVIWGCVVCENNSKVIWGCADRTVSSNSRHVVSFACLSGRSYRSLGERSVRGVGWGFLIWPSVKVISGRGIIHQITHNSLIHGSCLEENSVKN